MAMKEQASVVKTPVEDSNTNTEDTQSEEGEGQESSYSPLDDPKVQAEIDRRVTMAMKKASKNEDKMRSDIEAKIRKEMEEKKLLDDKEWQTLAERREQEAQEVREKLAALERRDNINALLDKKQVTESGFRELFHHMGGELAELDEQIDSFRTMFNESVERAVSKRLDAGTPPKGPANKPDGPKSIEDAIDKAQDNALKTGDWRQFMAVAEEKQRKARQAYPVHT